MNATTDSATYTSTARAIVRCSRKGCRRAYRLDFTTTTRHFAFNNRPAQTRTVTGAHVTNASYRDRYDLARMLTSHFECGDCGGAGATFDVVKGSFSEAVKCGARCRGAVGPACDCHCAGENHAGGHSAL